MPGKISLLLGVFLFIASTADGADPLSPPPADDSNVLLLRNGQVIEGQIARDGDHYTVTLPDQELQVPAADVEFFCHDTREGYRQKKSVIQANDIEQHLQLFLWCERHALWDCAGEELSAAESINREHPMIPVLRRRLKIEMQQKKVARRPADNSPPPPTNEKLDWMIRGMPPGTVAAFVQEVQPILLNHCPGAIGFELPGQKRLQLMRPPQGESPSRRITQRNLYAVLQCIDKDNPGESPLLKASVGLDAAGAVGSFPARQSPQYEKLAQWVYQVAQKPMPADEMPGAGGVEGASFSELADPASIPSGRASLNRSAPRLPFLPPPNRGKGKSTDESDTDSNSKNAAPTKPLAASRPAGSGHGVVKTAAQPAIDSIDPYDPATFNNQANGPVVLPTPAARVLNGNDK